MMAVQIKIFDVDFYTTSPTPSLDVTFSDFRKSPVYQVPVLRIFGATAEGKKICAHVHGVFPYFYVPFEGSDNDNILIQQITFNIDKAINISLGQSMSNVQHVYKVSLVSGIPFYGYHAKKHQFLKIYLYNPFLIKRINNLLFTETVLGKFYQPHETHIKFTLQFMIDYNLHGMSYANLLAVKYRNEELNPDDPDSLKKISLCELECDVLAEAILNRKDLERGKVLKNPGISALWEDERQRRRNNDDDSVLSHYLSMEKTDVPQSDSHKIFKMALEKRLLLTVKKETSFLNNSVYPAECKLNDKLLNCSLIDLHFPVGSQNSDETMNLTLDNTLDNTLNDNLADMTINEDVENLFEVLKSLEEPNVEDDSLLSQVVKDENEDNEYDMDLSLSLELSVKDEFKKNFFVEKMEKNDSEDDLDSTLIPQVDGANDKKRSNRKLKSTPITAERNKTRYKNKEIKNKCVKKKKISKKNKELIGEKVKGLISKEICFKLNKTMELLNLGFNPVFKLTEAYRKYKFYDMLGEITSNSSISYKKILERSSAKDSKYPLLSTDGTNDSDGEELVVKKKMKSRYSSLPVTISSPLKGQNEKFENGNYLEAESGYIEGTRIKKLKIAVNGTWSSESITNEQAANNNNNSIDNKYQNLTRSQIYDIEHNFFPVAGSSKAIDMVFESNAPPERPPTRRRRSFDSDEVVYSDKSISCRSPYTPTESPTSRTKSINIYRHIFVPLYRPPSRLEVEDSLAELNISRTKSMEPFYSKPEDRTNSSEIKTKTSVDKDEFKSIFKGIEMYRNNFKQFIYETNLFTFNKYCYVRTAYFFAKPVKKAPNQQEVLNWINSNIKPTKKLEKALDKTKIMLPSSPGEYTDESLDLSLTLTPCTPKIEDDTSNKSCQISGQSLDDTYGFKNSIQNLQVQAVNEHEFLTVLEIELHIETRGDFKPNPEYDGIKAIFYCILDDQPNSSQVKKGFFAVDAIGDEDDKQTNIFKGTGTSYEMTLVDNEMELIRKFIEFVKNNDPDVLVGYEIQMLSWGYLIDRSAFLGINIKSQLSRIKEKKQVKEFQDKEFDELKITGRIILDFWRLLRHEISVQSYTLENVVYQILQRRIPKYSFRDLSFWWEHKSPRYRKTVIDYYLQRVELIIHLMEQLDLIGRTSELARLFGILFYEVLSRGSQFRVESMMLRLAKPANYVPVSPSVAQRAKMKAPEYIALVLEPESKFYTEPVIVLDFQSLYPSIVIAYNYCYSTCVGRVQSLGRNSPFEFGATNLQISKRKIKQLLDKDCLNFSPCGVGFVKKNIRHGIMPKLLEEILDTRLMVKKSMKEYSQDKNLMKVLHNRQLGLKLIANVTYGYTAANFSGRMPCVELGDSIVSKAREILQSTIELVNAKTEWGAKVVYGDTDSLFVHCPGKTRQEAFSIGEKIVEAVGKLNPDPIKLKLEKVYHPCILQTKKRYVGYMYEKPDQEVPVYEAKGIETVRRDGCPAVAKMLEKTLRILFETKDVSQVRVYVEKQFKKIFAGRVSIQELTFAKEFRGFSGYKPGACVPSLELAKKWIAADKRAEPRKGERVPYCIINGPPGVPLIKLVRSPYELLNDPSLKANAFYYVTKVIIPPINRCFNIVGADLNVWFNQMSRKNSKYLPVVSPVKKSTISQYFAMAHCASCGVQTQNSCCDKCISRPQETAVILNEKIQFWEHSYSSCQKICCSCSSNEELKCISLDCPVLYRLKQTYRDLLQADFVNDLLKRKDLF